ncbi:hydroxymethylglutaryl-CoA reductase, degradative [Halomontanus rarus]|uniref:hydroxymethylglutaryl-CoA reductase, degradative n=1 Tax=Halomontanus rarus TaxID=3034020 RepID=UPI0023E7F04B|nr:hydroxymethylglutaryl-CoA reductase, degradative [Halovivax sp. TS33]
MPVQTKHCSSQSSDMDSRVPGFYELSPADRLEAILERCDCDSDARDALETTSQLDVADQLSENVISTIAYPLSIATNFRIDGVDRFVPMATEESSVVAASAHGAKLARHHGGFYTSVDGPFMIGQIQVTDLADPRAARARILEHASEIRAEANDQGVLVSHGGGCEEVTARVLDTPRGEMVVVHLVVNTQDAMGANAVNTMAEGVAPLVEELTGGEVILRILSNLADRRLARARCTIPTEALDRDDTERSGAEVRDRIVDAWAFAAADPYRAATHNKGVLNGMDSLALATMNDWRAIEAGAHAYAARDGYGPLTTYEVDADGNLSCSIEVPVQTGVVGGATRAHPTAHAAMELLDVDTADELAGVFASVGLAENVASMRALADEGIQTGHMKLHAKNVAAEAGAPEDLVAEIAARMVAEDDVRASRARELVETVTD